MNTLPNALTLFRLCAAPVVALLLVEERYLAGGVLFGLAALTDLGDGWLAKRLNAVTPLGAALDPLADKALAACTFLALAWVERIPAWLVLLVVARDLAILTGVAVLRAAQRPFDVRPLQISRVNTLVQIVYVSIVLCGAAFALEHGAFSALDTLLCYAAAATTALSWIAYGAILWNRLTLRATQSP